MHEKYYGQGSANAQQMKIFFEINKDKLQEHALLQRSKVIFFISLEKV